MCGRYGLTEEGESWLENFFPGLSGQSTHGPRYNISPGENIGTIIYKNANPHFVMMRWGIENPWNKPLKNKETEQKQLFEIDHGKDHKKSADPLLINARSEKLLESKFWKKLITTQRCLIPASFYYEWQKTPDNTIMPWMISLKNYPLFFFPAVYTTDLNNNMACSLLTRKAGQLLATIHNKGKFSGRQPLFLYEKKMVDQWIMPLSEKTDSADQLEQIISTAQQNISDNDLTTQPLKKTGSDHPPRPPLFSE